jgi:universal stress protein E
MRFTNILVDIDAKASAQPALEAGVRMARRCGAQLRVVDVTTRAVRRWTLTSGGREPLAPSMEALRVAAAEAVLSESPAEALVKEAARGGHDLLIRSQARDLVARGTESGVNLHLFRYCPCPVWALGPGPLPERPRIVAAVDPSAIEPEAEALSRKAIAMALQLAELEDGSVTILHAWRPVAEKQLYTRSTAAEFGATVITAESRAHEELDRLTGSFGRRLGDARIELRKGEPEEAIPEFVVAEGIDIVVAGARSDGGVWQRLFGSTAERLLAATPCSVVAVNEGR